MFDAKEYMLILEEQVVASQGMADCTNLFLRCMREDEPNEAVVFDALYRLHGYRSAYNALVDHAEALWNS